MTLATYQTGRATLRGTRSGEHLYLSTVDNPTTAAPVTTAGLRLLDLVYSSNVTTTLTSNFKVVATATRSNINPSFSSVTPAVCSVNSATGAVSWVANGACTIQATVAGDTGNISRTINQSAGTSNTVTGFYTGTLAKHIADNIAALVPGGLTPTDANRKIWNSNQRNSGIFASGIDLSSSSYTDQFPVHLLSARHFICASHIAPGVGSSITFVRNDNSTQTVTVSNRTNLGNDVTVGSLSADITAITPYSLLPTTYDSYIPAMGSRVGSITSYAAVPALNIEGHSGTAKLRILETYYADGVRPSLAYPTWTSPIIGGDSSGPSILPIVVGGSTKSVLIASMYSASGNGKYYHTISAGIQAAMDSLQSGYSLTFVNLSAFPTM